MTQLEKEKYPELNLSALKAHAHNWGDTFPCIQNISLYRVGVGWRNRLEYYLVVHVSDLPEGRPPLNEILWTDADDECNVIDAYYNWAYSDCLHIRENIFRFYMDLNRANSEEWGWFSLSSGETIEEFNIVRTETGINLYLRDDGFKEIKPESGASPEHIHEISPSHKDTSSDQLQADRAFILSGKMWAVTFNGATNYIKDCKPVQYILEVIRLQGKKVDYVTLGQICSCTTVPPNDECQEGLTSNLSVELDARDRQKIIDDLRVLYEDYKKNPDEEQSRWDRAKKIAETEYGILIKETANGLIFTNSKWKTEKDVDYERARKLASSNKSRFFKQIEIFPDLHSHFKKYLLTDNGFNYDPPQNSPFWHISDKKN